MYISRKTASIIAGISFFVLLVAAICIIGFVSRGDNGKWFANNNMSTWHWSDKTVIGNDGSGSGGNGDNGNDGSGDKENDYDTLLAQIGELREQINATQGELNKLKADKGSLQNTIDGLNSDLDELQQSKDELEQERDNLIKERDELQEQLDNAGDTAALEAQIADLQEQLANAEDTSELEAQIAALQEQLANAEDTSELEAQIAELNSQIAEKDGKLNQAETQRDTLLQQLSTNQTTITSLEEQLANAEQEMAGLWGQIQELENLLNGGYPNSTSSYISSLNWLLDTDFDSYFHGVGSERPSYLSDIEVEVLKAYYNGLVNGYEGELLILPEWTCAQSLNILATGKYGTFSDVKTLVVICKTLNYVIEPQALAGLPQLERLVLVFCPDNLNYYYGQNAVPPYHIECYDSKDMYGSGIPHAFFCLMPGVNLGSGSTDYISPNENRSVAVDFRLLLNEVDNETFYKIGKYVYRLYCKNGYSNLINEYFGDELLEQFGYFSN